MFHKNGKDTLYRLEGREREHMADVVRQLVAHQEGFLGLVRFIAKREGITDESVMFDQSRLAFVKPPAPPQA